MPNDAGDVVPERQAQRSKVFISYSRTDLVFADQLVAALEPCGFEPSIDRHEITGGEEWRRRLRTLIANSETVVFVLSPASAKSDMCGWEVQEADAASKRLIPVLCRPLEAIPPPQRLKDLDYIYFYPEPNVPGSGFGSGLARLVKALNTDLEWIRQHTRLMARAAEWDEAKRADNRLLSGSDIDEAKDWLAGRPKAAPEPTDAQRAFIAASEAAERERIGKETAREVAIRDAEISRLRAEQEAERLRLETARMAAEQAAAVSEGRRRRTQVLFGVPLVLALIGAGVGWLAYDNTRKAAELNRRAAEIATEQAKRSDADKKLAEEHAQSLEKDKKLAELQAKFDEALKTAVATPRLAPPEQVAEEPKTGQEPSDVQITNLISDDAISLVIAQEIGSRRMYDKSYNHPTWPGGVSGVTIGFGYDVGYVNVDELKRDLGSLLDASLVDRLAEAVGIKGEQAGPLAQKLQDIVVPWDAAMIVFRKVDMVNDGRLTLKAFPNSEKLPPDSFGALFSLIHNVGPRLTDKKPDDRKEMRAIRDLIAQGKFDKVPDQIRSMKRLWAGTVLTGLIKRREAEALLFEKGLASLN